MISLFILKNKSFEIFEDERGGRGFSYVSNNNLSGYV